MTEFDEHFGDRATGSPRFGKSIPDLFEKRKLENTEPDEPNRCSPQIAVQQMRLTLIWPTVKGCAVVQELNNFKKS